MYIGIYLIISVITKVNKIMIIIQASELKIFKQNFSRVFIEDT